MRTDQQAHMERQTRMEQQTRKEQQTWIEQQTMMNQTNTVPNNDPTSTTTSPSKRRKSTLHTDDLSHKQHQLQ